MARSAIDKQIRKINDRMQKLYEVYGPDSPSYQHYASTVQQNFDIKLMPDGRVKVREGKSNAGLNRFQQAALDDLIKGGDTVGSLRREAAKYAKQHGRGKLPADELDALVEKMDYVKSNRDLIGYISEQIKAGVAITDSMRDLYNRAAGRTEELSYDELYDLMQQVQGDLEDYYV